MSTTRAPRYPRTYTVRSLLACHRFMREHEPDADAIQVDYDTYQTARAWLAWFRVKLHEKINREDPRAGWRKMQDDYQSDLALDRRTIDDYTRRRIINSGCRNILRTPDLRRRYPEINSQPEW